MNQIDNTIFEEIIARNTTKFHNEILQLFDHRGFEYPASDITMDFRILLPNDNPFFRSARRKSLIGITIREKLVNPTLIELFQAQWGIDVSVDYSSASNLVFPDNEWLEKSHPFEFIIPTDQGRIGFRYTPVPSGYNKIIKQWFKQYNLEYIFTIDWDYDQNDFIGFSYSKEFFNADRMKCISLYDFFTMFFTPEKYNICLDRFRSAVRSAWNNIEISTVPELSPRYLYDFKNQLNSSLHNLRIDNLHYYFIDSQRDEQISNLIPMSTRQSIQSRCFDDGLYKSLFGKSDFAKCFLTAEYLFSIFQNGNNQLEYTAVVCGYLKCIEQFLYLIVKSMLDSGQFTTSYIHLKGNSTANEKKTGIVIPNPRFANNATSRNRNIQYLIAFQAMYESRFDISIVSLVNFLDDNANAWIIPQARTVICKLLRNYAKNCRNDFFHKDNIKNFNKVVHIQNDTVCILLLLLGNLNIPSTNQTVPELLEIYDDSFDRLVRKLKEQFPSHTNFLLQYGNKTIKAYRLYEQPPLKYNNEFGTLEDNSIYFLLVDSFDDIPNPEDELFYDWAKGKQEFIITKEQNIPDGIWILRHGNEHEIKW